LRTIRLSIIASSIIMSLVLDISPLFGGEMSRCTRSPVCWASTSAWALIYSAVKLFSNNSNLCDHGT